MLDGESLVLAVGLVSQPTSEHIAAARAMTRALRDEFDAALDLTETTKLKSASLGVKFFDRMNAYDYEEAHAFLAKRLGRDLALDFQMVHMTVASYLGERRPKENMDGINGPVILDIDELSLGQWNLEAATVEQARIVADMAAGALELAQVALFFKCFPLTYADVDKHITDELTRRQARKKGWQPEPFMVDSIRTYRARPWDTKVTLSGPIRPAGPPDQPKPDEKPPQRKAGSFDAEKLATPSQKVMK